MIGGLFRRLAYLKLLANAGTWRWVKDSVDYLVTDHLRPWTQISRSPHSMIHPTVSFRSAQNVEIGSHTRIQNGCVIWASPGSKIRIGDHTGLGPGTKIFSSNHQFIAGVLYVEQPWVEKDVNIGRDVWIGAGTIILPGVSIGEGCVIAAGSVVTRDVAPGSLAAGVPAKVLRVREPSPEGLPGAVDVDA